MKKFLSTAVLLGAALGAHAATLVTTFDVTGIDSWDALGSANNEVFNLDLDALFGPHTGYVLTGIGWDVSGTAIAPSWVSELTIEFAASDFSDLLYLFPFQTGAPGSESATSGGVLDLETAGPGLSVTLPDSTLRLEFFEDFDDAANVLDGRWTQGFVTLQFEATPVPEPASMAVLGLGALAVLRKRKKA